MSFRNLWSDENVVSFTAVSRLHTYDDVASLGRRTSCLSVWHLDANLSMCVIMSVLLTLHRGARRIMYVSVASVLVTGSSELSRLICNKLMPSWPDVQLSTLPQDVTFFTWVITNSCQIHVSSFLLPADSLGCMRAWQFKMSNVLICDLLINSRKIYVYTFYTFVQ